MEGKNKKKSLLAASVAGLLAVAGTMVAPSVSYADGNCQVATVCAGKGACGGADHACAGKNACKGQGWVKVTADGAACEAIGGKTV